MEKGGGKERKEKTREIEKRALPGIEPMPDLLKSNEGKKRVALHRIDTSYML